MIPIHEARPDLYAIDKEFTYGQIPLAQKDNEPLLETLVIISGSRCDLQCAHCLVESSPKNNNIAMWDLETLTPHADDAVSFGTKQFVLTGGEPTLLKEFEKIVAMLLEKGRVEIWTNGAHSSHSKIQQFKQLKTKGDLAIRISLDSYDQVHHEALRDPKGQRTNLFQTTLSTIKQLADHGMDVAIAVTPHVYSTPDAQLEKAKDKKAYIIKQFENLFEQNNIQRLPIEIFADMLEDGGYLRQMPNAKAPIKISPSCMQGKDMSGFLCHTSRSIQRINGKIGPNGTDVWVFPCSMIYHDTRFALGQTIADALGPTPLNHRNCISCYKNGFTCTPDKQ